MFSLSCASHCHVLCVLVALCCHQLPLKVSTSSKGNFLFCYGIEVFPEPGNHKYNYTTLNGLPYMVLPNPFTICSSNGC